MLAKQIREIFNKSKNDLTKSLPNQINTNYNKIIEKIKFKSGDLSENYNVQVEDIMRDINYFFKKDTINIIKEKFIADGFTCVDDSDKKHFAFVVSWQEYIPIDPSKLPNRNEEDDDYDIDVEEINLPGPIRSAIEVIQNPPKL